MSRIAKHSDNFPCIGCDESNFHLASTTWSSNFTSGLYPYNNLKDDSSSSNYARINVDKTPSSDSYFYALFDFSAIPNGATITNTIGKIRLYSSGNQATYRQVRWCIGDINTPITNSQAYSTNSNPIALTVEPLRSGGISVQDLKNVKCYVHYLRSKNTDGGQRYIYMYGADVTVDWEETLYAISISSSVQGVGISAQDSETTGGGTNVITVTGVSDLSIIKLMDNNVDVTSSLVVSGSNYTYTLNNVDADHTIVVEDNSSSSSEKSYVKKNNAFVESTNQYVKETNSWLNRTISKIFWKINGSWTETNVSMSGKTAFKIYV